MFNFIYENPRLKRMTPFFCTHALRAKIKVSKMAHRKRAKFKSKTIMVINKKETFFLLLYKRKQINLIISSLCRKLKYHSYIIYIIFVIVTCARENLGPKWYIYTNLQEDKILKLLYE